MSANSKRELLLETVRTALADIEWVAKVERQKLTIEELKNLATTQLPYLGMVGSLPDPRENTRGGARSADSFISDLAITIVCYGTDNVNPDSTISTYLDDLWRTLFALEYDRSLQVIKVDVQPTTQQANWKPYFAFVIKYVVTYAHDKGGI